MLLFYGCDSNSLKPNNFGQLHGIENFDEIINLVFEFNGFLDAAIFQKKLVIENVQRHYVVNYTAPNQNELTHWIIVISVAKSGEYIDSAKYDAIQKTLKGTPIEKIGKRYMDVDLINTASSFAPRGMFTGMVVTTHDDKYDIRILLSDMLEDDATPPNFDHEGIAKMILELYARKI